MITQDNLRQLLDHLGFTQSGPRYSKTIGDATLAVDFKMMNSPRFRQEAISKAVKSAGQNNINATKIRNIKVPTPPLAKQQDIVDAIAIEQRAIAAAEALIAAAPARKQVILERHL